MATLENKSDIDAMRAQIEALEGNIDGALLALAEKDDPESILRKLTILIDAERASEAAATVYGKPPHERWCEKATLAFAMAGDLSEASRLVEWAGQQRDPTLWQLAVVAKSRGMFLHAVREVKVPLLPTELNESQADGVRDALAGLEPILGVIKAGRRMQNGVEASAVALAMEFTYVLGDREDHVSFAELLWHRNPLPLNYAYAVIRKLIHADPELPRRLRSERGDSFEAKALAAEIEGIQLKKPTEALAAVRGLLEEYRSIEQTERLATLMLQLAQELPNPERESVCEEAEKYLGSDSRLVRLRAVEADLKAEEYEAAEHKLLTMKDGDDPNWLELMAGVKVGQGRELEALELLQTANKIFPEVGLLRKTAVLAERNGRHHVAAEAAARIVRMEPEDITARNLLAQLYTRVGEYEKAAEQYHELRIRRPTELAFGINQAVNLAYALKKEASLRIYDELCAADPPPVGALAARAFLLKTMGQAETGLKSLLPFKSKFHDNPQFLKAVVDLGYASKREREANWGFSRLQELQSQGQIEPVLQAVDISEVIEISRRHSKNEEKLNSHILRGELPWLLAGHVLNRTPMQSFHERTKTMRWLAEEPAAWAARNIYATNGYLVTAADSGRKWVEAIEAPMANSIVIDLTSFMTLHKLGILKEVADYFGKCLFPAEYRPASLREGNRLVAHQLSHFHAAQEIRSAVDAELVTVVDDEVVLPYIHEHRSDTLPEDTHSYGLVDLVIGLEAGRMLTDELSAELQAIAQRTTGVDDTHTAIQFQDKVRIDFSTIESIAVHGLLNAVTSSFSVCISKGDRERLSAELTSWEERQSLKNQLDSLWEHVSKDSRFVSTGTTLPNEYLKDDVGNLHSGEFDAKWLALFSGALAKEKNLPLLVDDRCCQNLIHRDRSLPTTAFGTDCVIAALLSSERLTVDRAADAYLLLIKWRFKFVVLPPPVLIEVAKRSLHNAPGHQLRRISRYVQECMRDPGLFNGFEQTEPPISMAQKLFMSWTNVLATFVVSVWVESEIPDEASEHLTLWALTECLPAPPAGMPPHSRELAEMQPKLLLSQAFIRCASLPVSEKANRALVRIASILGVTEGEYLRQVAEVAIALKP